MPIKLPKGFQRRKSSGNALEEVRNPPEQSFRVFERPGVSQKSRSTDAVNHLSNSAEGKPLPPLRPSYEDEDEDLFAQTKGDPRNRYGSRRENQAHYSDNLSGSGGTANSPSMAPYDSAASSARLSTTSTNPSSTDNRSAEHVLSPGDRPFQDIPVPPVHHSRPGFSLRSGGGGFSFSNRSHRSAVTIPARAHTPASEQLPFPTFGRDRAATASSASTATPPKLFDSDLSLDSSELDGFSNMFDNIGRRSVGPSPNASSLNLLPSTGVAAQSSRQLRSAIPAPLNVDRRQDIESSPYSSTSQDALLYSPHPTKTGVPQHTSASTLNRHEPPQRQNMQASQQEMTSNPWGIEDTPEVQKPNGFLRRTSPSPLSRGMAASPVKEAKQDNMRSLDSHVGPESLSPQQRPSSPGSQRSFDSSLAEEVDLAAQWREGRSVAIAPKTNNKIMTPAQFERYRKQQEMDRRVAGPAGDEVSDGEEDHYDDDDEAERDRQAVKQRRKQEAHLAVYRQSMMKVTGEQAGGLRAVSGLSAKLPRSSSTEPNNRMSYLTVDSKISGKSSNEEDEDEDVPLGILAAHGFPNKNRPPTRLVSSSSSSNILALNQLTTPPVAGSVAGTSARRGSVPVFARNLPQDPYFGAGIVNPSNREPLAMGGGASVVGVPPTPNMQPYPVHPAGLVGVIANEERSRAMRRGSPNAQGTYEGPSQNHGLSRSMPPGTMAPMGYPDMMQGMPPALTPGEMQMSQQMAQMMQMQAQWMQQMQQMMGAQSGQLGQPMMPPMAPMGPQPGMLAPPSQVPRPHSMPLAPSVGAPGQRSMSTLSPSMANWNRPPSFLPAMNGRGGQGYAASVAPSERSNVGLAPRYRPVSTATDLYNPASQRSSTFTSGTIRPVLSEKRPSGVAVAVTDDEDDDQGWKEMKAKRDKKKSTWKLKKAQTGLQDLFQGGL